MKKTISLILSSALLLSAFAGTVSAVPKKNKITMTIPSSYGSVYDRLKEAFSHDNDDDVYEEVLPIVDDDVVVVKSEPAPVEELAAEEAIVEEAPVEEAVAEEIVEETAGDYSQTNVQVSGIDEGDVVKTDGEYIYVLKMATDELVILDADGADTEVLSVKKTDMDYTIAPDWYENRHRTKWDYRCESLDEDPVELYIHGDRAAVVMSCEYNLDTRTDGIYDADSESYTLIKYYDISDPARPRHIASSGQSGTYETSRMTDGSLYLVTDFCANLDERENYEDYIPSLHFTNRKELVPVKNLIFPPEIRESRFTVIAEHSLTSGSVTASKAVLLRPDDVYMKGNHLYITDEYAYRDVLARGTESIYTVTETVSGRRTDIYKFELGEKIVTKAFCTVDGELLDQFALDEYKGNLRVVTTHQNNSRITYTDETLGFTNTKHRSSSDTSGLYIYDENLNLLGSVTGLAEDERVYSVRFDGNVGYFVTYRNIDPLFAVDLSNPREPQVMSALKIPGFSEYLHLYGDGLLFGLGMTDDRFGRVKMSMFDTSDPYDVTELHKLTLGADDSAALDNHRAILISPERGIIGIPTESGMGYSAKIGYAVYGYSENKGFERLTKIELDGRARWGNETRGLYIGNTLYIVAQSGTYVVDMTDYALLTTVAY
ncbi:MAG: beta-propeller domain-containing protein [Clostridia bacterium]|nr:beta-propeller domain-containing protein [Clostridia bacterium]